MRRIALLSDTHGHLPSHWKEFMHDAHEIWHAGDVGDISVLEALNSFRPIRCVYGNMDGTLVRYQTTEHLVFTVEGLVVYMVHIGGYPGRYEPKALEMIKKHHPGLFISGHSHILKVMPDLKYNLLHINPGAAGTSGIHQVITMLRFSIEGGKVMDLEISEIPRRSNLQD